MNATVTMFGLFSRVEFEQEYKDVSDAINVAKQLFDKHSHRNSRVAVDVGNKRVYAKYRHPWDGSLICEVV